ncbi:hypothetical protein [Antricoccus suffuscus]|uniref:hypothetical protein n=1 Tax=Antricoccus suffuscus TaxID=1629062 RepID=UPI0011B217D8|nr:hypothetical protein [Antricoccus suffuscus]
MPVTAATVAVSAATANGCTGQGGFGGQRGQRSANGQRPANGEGSTGTAHKSAADSKASTSHKFVRPTIGEVTAINGQGFTVKAVQRKSSAATASSSKSTAPSSRAASPTTSNVLVTTTGSTTYTDTVSADASALVVGKCLIATGTADDTGTVAANLLRVSSAGASGCSTASGRGRFGSPGAGGNG